MSWGEAQYVISEIQSKLDNSQIKLLTWINDLATYGELSYVYNNFDILSKLCACKEAINHKILTSYLFNYAVENNLNIGLFLDSHLATDKNVTWTDHSDLKSIFDNPAIAPSVFNNLDIVPLIVDSKAATSMLANSEISMALVANNQNCLDLVVKSIDAMSIITTSKIAMDCLLDTEIGRDAFYGGSYYVGQGIFTYAFTDFEYDYDALKDKHLLSQLIETVTYSEIICKSLVRSATAMAIICNANFYTLTWLFTTHPFVPAMISSDIAMKTFCSSANAVEIVLGHYNHFYGEGLVQYLPSVVSNYRDILLKTLQSGGFKKGTANTETDKHVANGNCCLYFPTFATGNGSFSIYSFDLSANPSYTHKVLEVDSNTNGVTINHGVCLPTMTTLKTSGNACTLSYTCYYTTKYDMIV